MGRVYDGCMERVCSYCMKKMGAKEPVENTNVTHGICPLCLGALADRMGFSVAESLECYDQPMMMVDRSNRVAGYNRHLSKVLLSGGVKPKELPLGEFIECRYSMLERTCGKNPQCRDCPFLQLVHQAFRTNEPQEKVRIDLAPISEDHLLRRTWTVTAQKVQNMVLLTFLDAAQPA